MPVNYTQPSSQRGLGKDPVQVLIVGGQVILQRALHDLIHPQPDMEVSMLTRDLLDACRWLKRGAAQVVVLDWPVFEHGTTQIYKDLLRLRPDLKWLAVSLYDDDFVVKQAFDWGIRGYVTKALAADTICAAIRTLQHGECFCSPDVMDSLPGPFYQRITSMDK